EILDLAAARLRVHPFLVAGLADVERRVDEDLDEAVCADHLAHPVARGAVGAHRGADDGAAVADDLRGHEADAEDVRVAILLREAEAFREMRADHVAVEQRDLAPVLEQTAHHDLAGRRLSGAAQAGEPDAEALAMLRRMALREDRGDLRTREPRG